MTGYIYDQQDWPKFHWRHEPLEGLLATVRHAQGRLIGRVERLGAALRADATMRTLIEDVVKTSEIDGGVLDESEVRSCLTGRLLVGAGAPASAGSAASGSAVGGVVAMVLDATEKYDRPLTAERLFNWHAGLFPPGHSFMPGITVGAWRTDATGPTQVVSGLTGRERVQYEAPPAGRLEREMRTLLDWFNAGDAVDPVLKAGIAHLWFVTIRPFDVGNGRIARAISDMALARSERSAHRCYSMSAHIRRQRVAYHATLAATQQGDLDVTSWLEWFLDCLGRAVDNAEGLLGPVLRKAHFWEAHAGTSINVRQRAVLDRLLDGFEGKLTSSRWAALMRCSQDTALRDIGDLVKRGILTKDRAGGRSTNYALTAIA
jgi:Fic family protein